MTKKKAFFIIGVTAILIALILTSCGLMKPLLSDEEMEGRLQELCILIKKSVITSINPE